MRALTGVAVLLGGAVLGWVLLILVVRALFAGVETIARALVQAIA